MDNPESNSNSNENETPTGETINEVTPISDAPFPNEDDGAEHESLERDQIIWLRNRLQEMTAQMEVMQSRLTDAAANFPTPESLAILVEQATAPEREALRKLMNELQDSASPTPQQSQETDPANPPHSDSIKTEAPQESADVNPAPVPAPPEKSHRRLIV